jgi:hypothetical protein
MPRNALARAVYFCRLGEGRDRSFENQFFRASRLNLLVAAIILWNTRVSDPRQTIGLFVGPCPQCVICDYTGEPPNRVDSDRSSRRARTTEMRRLPTFSPSPRNGEVPTLSCPS